MIPPQDERRREDAAAARRASARVRPVRGGAQSRLQGECASELFTCFCTFSPAPIREHRAGAQRLFQAASGALEIEEPLYNKCFCLGANNNRRTLCVLLLHADKGCTYTFGVCVSDDGDEFRELWSHEILRTRTFSLSLSLSLSHTLSLSCPPRIRLPATCRPKGRSF